jgi:hypothetical protein
MDELKKKKKTEGNYIISLIFVNLMEISNEMFKLKFFETLRDKLSIFKL